MTSFGSMEEASATAVTEEEEEEEDDEEMVSRSRAVSEEDLVLCFLGRVEKVVGIEVVGTGVVIEVRERQTILDLVETMTKQWLGSVRFWTVRNKASLYCSEKMFQEAQYAGHAAATVRSVFPSLGDVASFSYDNIAHNSALCFCSIYEKEYDLKDYPQLFNREGSQASHREKRKSLLQLSKTPDRDKAIIHPTIHIPSS